MGFGVLQLGAGSIAATQPGMQKFTDRFTDSPTRLLVQTHACAGPWLNKEERRTKKNHACVADQTSSSNLSQLSSPSSCHPDQAWT